MLDYTYKGMPVSQMRDEDIDDCLTNGVSIDGRGPPSEDHDSVMERLRIEKLIRALNLRSST